jgi:hypothetical protein
VELYDLAKVTHLKRMTLGVALVRAVLFPIRSDKLRAGVDLRSTRDRSHIIGLTADKSSCVKPVKLPHVHDVPQDCQGRFGEQRAKNASGSAWQFNHRRHLQGQKNDFNVAVYGLLKSGHRIL